MEGRLRVEEWSDRDGNNRYTLEVQGSDMQFISGGRSDEMSQDGPADNESVTPDSSARTAAASSSDDDIPF